MIFHIQQTPLTLTNRHLWIFSPWDSFRLSEGRVFICKFVWLFEVCQEMLHSQQAGTLQCSSQCCQCSQSSAGPVQGCQREGWGAAIRGEGWRFPLHKWKCQLWGGRRRGEGGGRRGREPGGSGGDQVPGDPGSGGRLIRFLMFLLQPRPDINIQTKLKQFCLLKHKQWSLLSPSQSCG